MSLKNKREKKDIEGQVTTRGKKQRLLLKGKKEKKTSL